MDQARITNIWLTEVTERAKTREGRKLSKRKGGSYQKEKENGKIPNTQGGFQTE